MGTDLTILSKNPSELGFPPTLPMEVAMKAVPIDQIIESYRLTPGQWADLEETPLFRAALAEAEKVIKSDGGAFRLIAKSMSQDFLRRMYDLAHAESGTGAEGTVPPAVQSDIMKFVIRAAGLDASIDQKGAALAKGAQIAPLQININLA